MASYEEFRKDIIDALGLDEETWSRLQFYRNCIANPEKKYEGNCAAENIRGILVNVVGFSEEEAQDYINNIDGDKK